MLMDWEQFGQFIQGAVVRVLTFAVFAAIVVFLFGTLAHPGP